MQPTSDLLFFRQELTNEPGRQSAGGRRQTAVRLQPPTNCRWLINIVLFVSLLTSFACQSPATDAPPETTYAKWHPVTLSFEGPETSESAEDNPFLNYRLVTTFRHEGTQYEVPGFYAADGQADESGADAGSVWQVRFSPDAEGEWTYQVSFRRGDSLAVNDDPQAGEPVAFDGAEGSFRVTASDKTAPDFRATGLLRHRGGRYLQFAETGEYFLKGGPNSPENLLGYQDFDGTVFGGQEEQREGEAAADEQLHVYQDHVADWHEGDPTWQGIRGRDSSADLITWRAKG